MSWQYTDYAWPYLISFFVAVALLINAWPRRSVSAARSFIVFTAIAGVWSLLAALQLLAVGLPHKMFWSLLRYVAIVLLPVSWLVFTLAYTGFKHWQSPGRIAYLLIIPVITLAMVATSAKHGLMFKNVEVSDQGYGLAFTYGPWFRIHTVYSYLVILMGIGLLMRQLAYGARFYRGQVLLLVAGSLAPLFVNLMYLSSPERFAHIDVTPLAFMVSGVFFAAGLFWFQFLKIVPKARSVIVENIPDAVLVLDLEHNIVDMNPTAEQIFGQTYSTIIGSPIQVLLKKVDLTFPEEPFDRVIVREVDLTVGPEVKHFDCRIIPLHRHLQLRPEHAVMLLFRDNTEHIRIQRALRKSEEHFRLAVQAAKIGTWEWDIETDIIQWSDEACSLMALTMEGSAGPPHVFLQSLPSTDYKRLTEAVARACEAQTSFMVQHRVEFPDGTTRWVSNQGTVFLDPAGTPARLIGTVTDITSRKQYEASLIEAKESAEQLSQLKSSLLTNMSHEIRTPLTGIISYAAVLDELVESNQKPFVQVIERSGQRLLETLNAILRLAKLKGGHVKVNAHRINVVDEVTATVDLLRSLAHEKGLKLEVQASTPEIWTELDPLMLHRIITNLVGNAIKFTHQGGVKVNVSLKSGHVLIAVRDTGIGIDTSFLGRIFEDFSQESSGFARAYEGSGLGLSIARRLTELQNGTIHVESEKSKGSVFTLSFPIGVFQDKQKTITEGRQVSDS